MKITMKEIARRAGVSPSTISLAFRNSSRIPVETKHKILRIASELNYVYPRKINRKVHGIISLIIEQLPIPAISDSFCGEIIQGMEAAVREYGYHLSLYTMHIENGNAIVPPTIKEGTVDGILILGGGDISDDFIRELLKTGLPTVLVDNYVIGERVDCVIPDNITGAAIATEYLIKLGHRRIGIIKGPKKYKTLTDRFLGYIEALEAHNIEIDPQLIPEKISHGPAKGYLETKYLLQLPNPPTAIFAISDKTAMGALQAIREANLRVPEDISLIGFDDIVEAAHLNPPLTTVRVPKKEMGEIAVVKLLSAINRENYNPSKTVLYTELVERESCQSLVD